MNETSRKQGWAITGGAVFLGLLFLTGLLNGSYLALAIPVAILTFFVLGLVAWVGHTIATVQVEADPPASQPAPPSSTGSSAASSAAQGDSSREATGE